MNTVPLFNVRGDDVKMCGVKGAHLGELMSIGLPVPGGFVVTVDAYKTFMDESEIGAEIKETLSQMRVVMREKLISVSASIQSKFQQVAIGGHLSDEIQENIKALKAHFMAVRSSPAIMSQGNFPPEMLRLATSLNVKPEKVEANIQHCWYSLYIVRALEYLYEHEINPADVAVAVVVQEMVDAVISGVCYTADPKERTDDKVYIEAGWGLGEAMVSGIVAPDRCSVNKKTLKLGTYTIGKQMKEVVREEQLHRLVDVPEEKQKKRKLENGDLKTLARLCLQIEEYYGKPQEVEWASDGKHFFILQTKDLT